MSISQLRDDLQKGLVDFLWDEWGQMGVSTDSQRRDDWAMDPEALLLLTFEVARAEPRLFAEVLDWMLVNEKLISVQRLRNLAEDEADRALVEAVIGWLGQGRRRERLKAKPGPTVEPQAFYRGSRLETVDPDPAFEAQGFLMPRTEPSGKSQAPDVRLPINLAFNLRRLLGVSVRAEAVRVLLTVDSPWMNVQALAESTAYTKRNVQETLTSLALDGFVSQVGIHNENRYAISRARWASFLELDPLPSSIDWPQVSRAFRVILRGLIDLADQDLSEYILMSNASTIVEAIEPDLRFAGFPLRPAEWTRDLPSFESFVRELSRNLLSVDL
jgi:hypothetical protein